MTKAVSSPPELLGLPFPWNQTHLGIRREYLWVLDTHPTTIKKTLSVLERSLKFASEVSYIRAKYPPKELRDNWEFCYSEMARKIPQMEQFDLAPFELVFQEKQIIDISPATSVDIAIWWIWYVSFFLAKDSIIWCRHKMKNCPEEELAESYLAIASKYWLSSVLSSVTNLLAEASLEIAPELAIPLLEQRDRQIIDASLAPVIRGWKWLYASKN